MPTGVGLTYNTFFKEQPNANNSVYMPNGTLNNEYNTLDTEEASIIDKKTNNSGSGNNVMNSIFSNLGGWLSGAGNLINSIKGNPVQNPNAYYPTTPPEQRNNMWIWIVAGVLVLGVAGFFLMKKK